MFASTLQDCVLKSIWNKNFKNSQWHKCATIFSDFFVPMGGKSLNPNLMVKHLHPWGTVSKKMIQKIWQELNYHILHSSKINGK